MHTQVKRLFNVNEDINKNYEDRQNSRPINL